MAESPQHWLGSIVDSPAADLIRRRLETGGDFGLRNVPAGAIPFCIAVLRRLFPERTILAVASTLKEQERLHADLAEWLRLSVLPGGSQEPAAPLFFPSWEILPHEKKAPHADVISERLETLLGLSEPRTEGSAPTIVASVAALMQKTFAIDTFRTRTRTLRRSDRINPLDLIEWLEDQGYEPEAQVTHRGEISWRGGIVDVWPMSAPWPVRLEFFGDELDSLREFDPHHQRSRETIDDVVIPPAGELSLFKAPDPSAAEAKTAGSLETLLAYLPPSSLLILGEPGLLSQTAEHYQANLPAEEPFHTTWAGILVEARQRSLVVAELEERIENTAIEEPRGASELSEAWRFESLDAYRPLGGVMPAPQVAETQRREFFSQIHRWIRQGIEVQIICANHGELQRFAELWNEYGLEPALSSPSAEAGGDAFPVVRQPRAPVLRRGSLSRGFIVPWANRVIVTDAEIFGRYRVQRPRRLKSPHAQVMKSAFEVDFTDFEEGDYVVHLEHGIGIYRGLQTVVTRSKRGEAVTGPESLVIEYAPSVSGDDPPRLYVPVTEAHLVGKYVGAGKARPQINVLGSSRWSKAKEQAGNAIRDLAGDLLSIQAARSVRQGHAFSADNNWQREFEASFEYEETGDQLKAIDAVKRDMESTKPMDRLLCGDVGFGKTEVAIRAAFKAVMGGKQVAVLVPTTVLAQQHYRQFRERMAEYPVRVEVLSRFRSARQQKEVLAQAAAGSVDIVIGTHRIVQGDVQFKNLGLVVVDEEQRFGVKHKERFKLLRETVDVLTLSATPIPRTLYLALTGARDLSTLETPPQDRLPVETTVCNYDERIVRDAILRELGRGGQVYFLHNRVSTIDAVATRLKALVPGARMVIGHGQMDDDDLERVMTRFVDGEADVLVSTTIIESGLDIPNANTIIIDRADRFGLSELYQLRGRVGRYKHQAYAYLLLPRHAQLLTEARKRMSAIRQYSALGSGFKIAMRDLEIRGAGNILGAQQSGHITAVGFDLYCQLLARSIRSLKGEKEPPLIQVQTQFDFLASHSGETGIELDRRIIPKPPAPAFDIDVPRDEGVPAYVPEKEKKRARSPHDARGGDGKAAAFIPLDYIREPSQRVEAYRKLMQAGSKEELGRFREELHDRFGPPPPAVDLMLQAAELRFLAAQRKISSIEVTEGKIKITRNGDLITVSGQFPRLTKKDARGRLNEIRKLLLSIA